MTTKSIKAAAKNGATGVVPPAAPNQAGLPPVPPPGTRERQRQPALPMQAMSDASARAFLDVQNGLMMENARLNSMVAALMPHAPPDVLAALGLGPRNQMQGVMTQPLAEAVGAPAGKA